MTLTTSINDDSTSSDPATHSTNNASPIPVDMISNIKVDDVDDRRNKIKKSIAHRRRLLSWTSSTRQACHAILTDLSTASISAEEERVQFHQLSTATVSSSKAACGLLKRKSSVLKTAVPNNSEISGKQQRISMNTVSSKNGHSRSNACSSGDVVSQTVHPSSAAFVPTEKKKWKKSLYHTNTNCNIDTHRSKGGVTPPTSMELSCHASFAIEWRDEILSKLSLFEQPHRNQKTLIVPTNNGVRNLVLSRHTVNAKYSRDDKSQIAPRLPPKRKGHWDFVLEEMRCVASDYIGERTWKLACGALLSESLQREKMAIISGGQVRKRPHSNSSKCSPKNDGKKDPKTKLSSPPSSSTVKTPFPFSLPSLYQDISTNDIQSSKHISQSLSIMVLDYWSNDCFVDGTSFIDNKRLNAMQSKFSSKFHPPIIDNKENECNNVVAASPSLRSEEDGLREELSYEDISKRVQSCIEKVSTLKRRRNDLKLQNDQEVTLNKMQHDAVSYVERLWNETPSSSSSQSQEFNVSAVLGGDYGTGKTITACYLIWKRRLEGRQLVLCSPNSVLRWKEELIKFHDLNVNVINNSDEWSCKSANVILCDCRTFVEMMKTDRSHEIVEYLDLSLLCMDLRYVSNTGGNNHHYQLFESEVFEWWDTITKFAEQSSQSRRLLIEHHSVEGSNCINSPCAKDDASSRMFHAKLLAMKMSFVYHPLLFTSTVNLRVGIGKRVVLWVKDQRAFLHNMLKLSPTNNDLSLLDLFQLIVNELIGRVRFVVASDTVSKDLLRWETHNYPIPIEQQVVDKPIFNSTERQPVEFYEKSVNLPRVCYHDDRSTGRKTSQWQDMYMSRHAILEPDTETAMHLMEKSAKLREIHRLLATECGYDTGCEQVCNDSSRKVSTHVLILASLFETQNMTSFFLSCLGIRNEVLASTSQDAWNRIQRTLSLFNKRSAGAMNPSKTTPRIIISSPAIMSSLYGGICPTSAQVVIYVDEDQGGYETSHLISLAKKIGYQRRCVAIRSQCKLIKLVNHTYKQPICDREKANASMSDPTRSPIGVGLNNSANAAAQSNNHIEPLVSFTSEQKLLQSEKSLSDYTQHANYEFNSPLTVKSVVDTDLTHASFSFGLQIGSTQLEKNHSFMSNTSSCLNLRLRGLVYSDLHHYMQSFSSMNTISSEGNHNHDINLALRKTMVPKQETTCVKKVELLSAPDVNSILSYDIPTTSLVDPIEGRNHRDMPMLEQVQNSFVNVSNNSMTPYSFGLGFYIARHTSLTGASNSDRGIQSLVYIPPCPISTKRSFATEIPSSISQKRMKLGRNNECREDNLIIETNPYPGSVTDSSLGLEFSKKYSVEIIPHNQCHFSNSIIIVAQKKQSSLPKNAPKEMTAISSRNNSTVTKNLNSDEKKSTNTKKTKIIVPSYFKTDKSFRRAYATRDGIHASLATSIIFSVRAQCQLSDVVSDQYHQSQHSKILLLDREFAPFRFGERARENTSKLIQRERNRGGILLPMGVTTKSRWARKLTNAQQETIEPWSDRDDILLQESVTKYGMNWHLVAKEMSSPSFCDHSFCDILPIRSPHQCQSHWGSSIAHKTIHKSPAMADTVNTSSNAVLRPVSENFASRIDCFLSNKTLQSKFPTQSKRFCGDSQQFISGSMLHVVHHTNSIDPSDLTSSIKNASTKKRVITTTIPGSTTLDGETTIRLVPVHASHRETLQAATASSLPRSDMWPMEFIDQKEKSAVSSNPLARRETSVGMHQPHHMSSYNGAHNVSNMHPQVVQLQGGRGNFEMHNKHPGHHPSKPS